MSIRTPEPGQGRLSFASRTAFELLAPSDDDEVEDEEQQEEEEKSREKSVVIEAYVRIAWWLVFVLIVMIIQTKRH